MKLVYFTNLAQCYCMGLVACCVCVLQTAGSKLDAKYAGDIVRKGEIYNIYLLCFVNSLI